MREREIFTAALEIPDPADRAAYLGQACGGDPALRSRVDALLLLHSQGGDFLDRPAVEQIAGRIDCPGVRTEAGTAVEEGPSLDFLDPPRSQGALGRLGHYEVLGVVGRGGMGVVLKAFDENLHRVVAIKVMAPQLATSATARKRFLREARAAAAVTHDNVVTIHAVEEGKGVPYLVMQFVAGVSLQDKLDREGPLELREVLRIGMQTAAGLAAAHAHGIIHRDVKPANILLENGVERVKITDFGLARAADDASLTQSGVIAGTPMYMSPEQAEGRPADHRSDLFSLGSVLYALCTGRPPFRADTATAVLRRVCEDTPRPVREVNPEVPDWLCDVITKLHAKDPAERFQSAAEVAALLGRRLAQSQQPVMTMATEEPRGQPTQQVIPLRRRRWLAAAVVLLVLVTGVSLTEATDVTRITKTVLRLFTPDGTLVVEVDDPGVKVTIDGEDLVIQGAGLQEVRLKPGTYQLRATKDGEPVKLSSELITISRGGKQVVRVSREPRETVGEIRRFEGSNGWVTVVAYSPDGNRILSAERDGTMRLWDVETGKALRQLRGHKGEVWGVEFSPDSRRAISGGADRTVRLWDLDSGQELRRFEGHADWVWSVAFSPDGSRVLSGGGGGFDKGGEIPGSDYTVRVWDVETGEVLQSLKGHTGMVTGVAFSPDGKQALSGSWDKTLRLWDIDKGKEVQRIEGHKLRGIAFSPNGRQALAVGYDNTIRLWDLEGGKQIGSFLGHTGDGVPCVAFSPDGRRALSGGGADRTVRLWDVDSRKELHCFEGHTDQVFSVAFSPDGHRAISGGADGTVRLWRLPVPVTRTAAAVKPFMILAGDGKAVRGYATLAEAVLGASDGDTIEVRGNGPFVTHPIDLRRLRLTIRAGAGFRPVLRLSPEGMKVKAHLLRTDAPLVLEGLELQRLGDEGSPRWQETWALVGSSGAALHVTNCRFLMKFSWGGIMIHESPLVEIRNCEFVGANYHTAVEWQAPSSGTAVLENCVAVGGHGGVGFRPKTPTEPGRAASLRLTHNTLAQHMPLKLSAVKLPGPDAEAAPLRLELVENVLDGDGGGLFFLPYPEAVTGDGKGLSRDEAEGALRRLISWGGRRNLYSADMDLLKLALAKGPHQAGSSKSLDDWKRFWQSGEAGSIVGRVRYQGGDPRTRPAAEPERLSPENFRLRPDGPGQGAGEGGRDLGADVSLVGPGEAYERWRKTPGYKQWLEDTGQLQK